MQEFFSFIVNHADALITLGAMALLNWRRNQTRGAALEQVKATVVDTAVQLAEARLGQGQAPAK